MPTINELQKQLDEGREALAKIFEQAGPERDFTKITLIEGSTSEKATQVRKRNEELTALAKEIEDLKAMDNIAKETEEHAKARRTANNGVTLPGGTDAQKARTNSPIKTLGQMFVESASFKSFSGRSAPSTVIEWDPDNEAQNQVVFGRKGLATKALFDTTSFPPEVTRQPGIIDIREQQPVIEDLIPTAQTTQSAIKYMEETLATNGATPVAEGGEKPESALEFEEKIAPIRKIATVLPVTDEAFDDAPGMRAYIDNRGRQFVGFTRGAQLLNGNGTAPNIRGIMNTSGVGTRARDDVNAEPRPDAIYKAMTDIRIDALLQADGSVWNPLDWQEIRLLRTDDGVYIWGSPMDAGPERIWGLPIVQTTEMPEGTVLVGAFGSSAMIWRRSQIEFSVSDSHADFFITNKLMLRFEERLGLVVYRPAGFVKVTGM